MAGVTILGAAGFVGSRLRDRLVAEGVDVYAPPKGDPMLFERDLGCVFYCAGLTADYAARPFDTIDAHVTLLAKLAERGTFERIVYTSSTRLYDAGGGTSAGESDPLTLNPAEPRHLYDLSKALGENIVLTQTTGRGAVARLANVFDWSPGSQGFLSDWLIQATRERVLTIDSSPAICRDYIHVGDVVEALVAIASKPGIGVVNVGGGELVSNAQVAAACEEGGWSVTFTRPDAPPSPPCADIGKLRSIGVAPRSALAVVKSLLQEIRVGATD